MLAPAALPSARYTTVKRGTWDSGPVDWNNILMSWLGFINENTNLCYTVY